MKNNFQAVAVCLVSTLLMAGCNPNAPAAPKASITVPDIPPTIKTDAGETVATVVTAKGYQIYECKFDTVKNEFGWSLKAPVADLFDANQTIIGTHYQGPTWEMKDGSKVVGKVKTLDPAAGLGLASIPWVLLDVTEHAGTGVLSAVTKIQRVSTTGGVKPAGCCDSSFTGTERYIPYTATYIFYNKK